MLFLKRTHWDSWLTPFPSLASEGYLVLWLARYKAWSYYLKAGSYANFSSNCFFMNRPFALSYTHTVSISIHRAILHTKPYFLAEDNSSLFHNKRSVVHISPITSIMTHISSQKSFPYSLPTHSIITHHFQSRESYYSDLFGGYLSLPHKDPRNNIASSECTILPPSFQSTSRLPCSPMSSLSSSSFD